MAASTKPQGRVLTPRESIATAFDGALVTLHAGITHVREGHPLVAHCGADAFRPIVVHFEV